jgi:hypothetical protein
VTVLEGARNVRTILKGIQAQFHEVGVLESVAFRAQFSEIAGRNGNADLTFTGHGHISVTYQKKSLFNLYRLKRRRFEFAVVSQAKADAPPGIVRYHHQADEHTPPDLTARATENVLYVDI